MAASILIVGQGLAGTVLGLALERAGREFVIADPGHAPAASLAAAGIINPVTGRRLVRSWRFEELFPLARRTYREIETRLGVPLWRELRVHRRFRDERERRVFAEKQARGELAPFVEAADETGCWLAPAARVDVPALLAAARRHWQEAGVLRETTIDWAAEAGAALVIDCTGASARRGPFAAAGFALSKGETLQVDATGLAPDVILNRGHWLVPLDAETAWAGATHEPGIEDAMPTPAARARLLADATALAGRPVTVRAHLAGLRLTTADKHPVAGRHPAQPHLGICGALGGKGALYAPWLAAQWVAHLQAGAAFDDEVSITRLMAATRDSSQT